MAHVLFIGAGVVGLAAARAFQRAGHRITLIDPEPPGSQTSYGNAGLIAGSAVVPEARPDLLWRLPKLMLDRDGPLAVKVRHLPRMIGYARHLAKAARPAEVERISKAMAALSLPAYDDWMALLDDMPDARSFFRRDGCVYLYRSQAERRAADHANEIRRRRGMRLSPLNRAALRQLAPILAEHSEHAVLSEESGHVTSPIGLSEALAEALSRDGAAFEVGRVTGFEGEETCSAVRLADGTRRAADTVMICAGARSAALARAAGGSVPMDSERGYHLQLDLDPRGLNVPILVPSMGVGATPMSDGIRIAGLVEFGGLNTPPTPALFARLERRARILFGDVDVAGAGRWMGLRPSLPDGLPVIDRSPRFSNVWGAFGHGQMGLTQAARTALALRAAVEGAEERLDRTPYRWTRFG